MGVERDVERCSGRPEGTRAAGRAAGGGVRDLPRRLVACLVSVSLAWSLSPALTLARAEEPAEREVPAQQEPVGGGAEEPDGTDPAGGADDGTASPKASAGGPESPADGAAPAAASDGKDEPGAGEAAPAADVAEEVRREAASRADLEAEPEAVREMAALFDMLVAVAAADGGPGLPEGGAQGTGQGGSHDAELAEAVYRELAGTAPDIPAPDLSAPRRLLVEQGPAGIAHAYALVASELGVGCVEVSSADSAWVMAELDGTWYHVDPAAAACAVRARVAGAAGGHSSENDAPEDADDAESPGDAAHAWLLASDGGLRALDPAREGWLLAGGGEAPEAAYAYRWQGQEPATEEDPAAADAGETPGPGDGTEAEGEPSGDQGPARSPGEGAAGGSGEPKPEAEGDEGRGEAPAETAGKDGTAAPGGGDTRDVKDAPERERTPLREAIGSDVESTLARDAGDRDGLATVLAQATGGGERPVAAPTGGPALSAQSMVASGTWGTCPWEIDSDYRLTVHAGKGADQGWSSSAPWGDKRAYIKSAAFEQGVVLPASCSGLFRGCSSLTSLDLSGWDVSSVTGMSSMFYGCSRLASLDLSGWDVSSVTGMSSMFYGCSRLASLDLSGWDVSSVTNMVSMFSGCSRLSSLDVSGWDVSSVTNMYSMFDGCSSLASLDLSGWDMPFVTDVHGMFYGCSSLASLDVSGWDVPSVRYMFYMFRGCSSLASLDVAGWDMPSVTAMDSMFNGCASLTSLDLSGWDVSSVTGMGGMFQGCSRLSSLDVSRWDVSSVTGMRGMFDGCSSLASLDVSHWDVSSVTDMRYMFYGCSSLASLDLSGWDTSSVTDMGYMFYWCSSLRRFRVGAGFRFRGADSVPAPAAGDAWLSTADGRSYTQNQIASGRSGIADTYLAQLFPDVPSSHWACGVVSRAAGLGLITGYSDGRFGPEEGVTRGQVATILWRMAGQPSGSRGFSDLGDPSRYYYKAVRWAGSAGVVNGYGDGRFGPEDPVTREQLAAMLANYASMVARVRVDGSAADYASMRDRGSVSSWAQRSLGWCYRKGIMSGTGDGRIDPQGGATRAQAAKMMVGLHDLVS